MAESMGAISFNIKSIIDKANDSQTNKETVQKEDENIFSNSATNKSSDVSLEALNDFVMTYINDIKISESDEFSESDEISDSSEIAQAEESEKTTKPKNDEAPKLYEGSFNTYKISEKEYDFENLPMEKEYKGKTYHCVGFSEYIVEDANGNKITWKPESWEEVQEYFDKAGVENEGRYGTMQCQNYSDLMGQFVLGVANMDIVQALYDETNDPNFPEEKNDYAGYLGQFAEYNLRNYAPCRAANRDVERSIIENELQNGRPALVKVNDHHWCTAVGLSDDGDILIWDSLNGYMRKLYQTASSKYPQGQRNPAERNLSYGNGAVMVYVENFHYENKKTNYINYIDDYINGSSEKARMAGIKAQN